MTNDEDIIITKEEIEKYTLHHIAEWSDKEIKDYAIEKYMEENFNLLNENKNMLVSIMTNYYGYNWLRRKKLEIFK